MDHDTAAGLYSEPTDKDWEEAAQICNTITAGMYLAIEQTQKLNGGRLPPISIVMALCQVACWAMPHEEPSRTTLADILVRMFRQHLAEGPSEGDGWI